MKAAIPPRSKSRPPFIGQPRIKQWRPKRFRSATTQFELFLFDHRYTYLVQSHSAPSSKLKPLPRVSRIGARGTEFLSEAAGQLGSDGNGRGGLVGYLVFL